MNVCKLGWVCAIAAALALPPRASIGVGDKGEKGFEHPFETDELRKPALHARGNCLIWDAVIHSGVEPERRGDVLVRDGKIAQIGRNLSAPEGALVIDAHGLHLAPGVIDTHSHMAIDGDVNEGTLSITAECDISDVIDPYDIGIYRALAGGVTVIQCLHGSANAIGGRSEVIELRWKSDHADDLRVRDAPQGIKFALGENPKRSNWGAPGERFPNTRMGVEAVYGRAFERAQDYSREWRAYDEATKRGEDPVPPRRDLRLEVLAGILKGEVQVHSHCYRADEILMLIRVAERFGFRIQTFQHVLEGYKVAWEMAKHGVGGSTFSDWWAYKIEAYDAVPQNAALMDEAGVVSSVNSDSGELVRHLYQEAGKSVRYAGLDRVRALRLATLNSAIQLGLEGRMGSIEPGKDANLALLSGDPLEFSSRVEWTLVQGEIQFQRRDAFGFAERPCSVPELTEPARPMPEIPAGAPVVAITGGTVHPVTSTEFTDGIVILRGGFIEAVGRGLPIPAGATVIDASGLHVWPGILALNSSVGIREIGSVRGTDDLAELGGNQPDLRVAAAIHPDSAHMGVTRTNGITRSETAPQGGGPMMGQSALIKLAGDTWEEMLTQDRSLLHVRFPQVANNAKEKQEPPAVKELSKLLTDAREYGRIVELARTGQCAAPRFDPRLDALVPYARGEKPVALHADNAQTILYALRFARKEKLDVILYGVTEGWKVADAIARERVPVVIGPVLGLPASDFDPYDACYANAAVLQRAGVPFAIMSDDVENPRNVAFHAATAAAYGLPREEAVRAITFYAARTLGLESQLGSLAPGKIADLILTTGDLLSTTAEVTHVLIDGVQTSMENRQSQLYQRYRERLHRLQGKPK